jgi:hypothetical protein
MKVVTILVRSVWADGYLVAWPWSEWGEFGRRAATSCYVRAGSTAYVGTWYEEYRQGRN